MGTETKGGLRFDQAGQPATTSQQPVSPTGDGVEREGATEQQPIYLTRAEALQLLREEFPKLAQSISDKTASRVAQRVQALSKVGITATPEQVAQLVLEEGDPEHSPTTDVSKPSPAQAKGKGAEDTPPPVMQLAQSVLAKAGLTDKDFTEQEAEYINAAEDEVDFITRLKQAAQQKVAQRGSPSRTPAINTGGPSTLGGKDALTRELQTLLQNPLANRTRIKEVKGLLSKYN